MEISRKGAKCAKEHQGKEDTRASSQSPQRWVQNKTDTKSGSVEPPAAAPAIGSTPAACLLLIFLLCGLCELCESVFFLAALGALGAFARVSSPHNARSPKRSDLGPGGLRANAASSAP